MKSSESTLYYKILGELPYPEPAAENIVRLKVPKPTTLNKSKKDLLYPDNFYEDLLTTYFRLNFDLESSYKKWQSAHKHFASKVDRYQNIRQLNIDCVENLFSFICSQNNHITRISSLVNKLCSNYGELICEHDGQKFYAFPELERLAEDGVEAKLRDLGFGYRAKYIQKSSAEIIEKGGLKWFQKVIDMSYENAHKELTSLTGIGPKVADCICLMSLNHLSAIPVDTHVIQIAKHYLPEVEKMKSMTPTLYKKIGDEFRKIYGEHCGWAQTVLFVAELGSFKEKKELEDKMKLSNKKQKKK